MAPAHPAGPSTARKFGAALVVALVVIVVWAVIAYRQKPPPPPHKIGEYPAVTR